MTVNKERVELLCRALESGEFAQTGGELRDSNGHCCLGVATEVALRNGLPIPFEDPWNHENGETLHYQVRDWYGFDDEDPTVIVVDEEGGRAFFSATEVNDAMVNDVHRYPFSEIAAGFHRMYLEEKEVTVNKERVQMLVDALRSGDYQQVRGFMFRFGNARCALGVADVIIPRGAPLLGSIGAWYGFEEDLNDNHILEMNDDLKMSFFEIADALYARYLKDPE